MKDRTHSKDGMSQEQARRRFAEILLAMAAVFSALLSILFGFLYFELYWRWRDLFYENGRYFDEQNAVVYQDDSAILIVPTLCCVLLTLVLTIALRVRRRRYLRRG
ncbi:DUF3379 domain-containing protein [Affinibrenneria salicis]|uniref:DUF3379 domain-containing protein n=1 Tax=Affinibrenneria salicis TaxID=2590031 RepID=A0A5J5FYJ1_9GAMM|nr:DUF3379 domain-containing protein [Affinibrenneria salicis]KAA8998124.1 DUF3379 domain-containing protein [Affinibrenneria salicis]